MSDWFYSFIRRTWMPPLWLASGAVALHADRLPRTGGLILASNHCSPYDVPCLIRSTPRHIDFLSVVEAQRKPVVGRFYAAMNCVFLDRQRRDVQAVRAMRQRLDRGRLVCMFPEGGFRAGEQSVTHGGPFNSGVVRLAQQANVPIMPCVLMNTERYSRPINWLPFQRWNYGINYGETLAVGKGEEALAAAIASLGAAYVRLADELREALTADT